MQPYKRQQKRLKQRINITRRQKRGKKALVKEKNKEAGGEGHSNKDN